MVTEAVAVKKEFFTAEFLAKIPCSSAFVSSPIGCFGSNRKFLKVKTHNNIWGEYVS